MNRKQLILLVVVLVVLGAGAWISKRSGSSNPRAQGSELAIGSKLLPDFQLNSVAQINILQATQQLALAKEGDIWTVKERGNYPANFGNISELVRKFWDMKVAKPVRVPASRLPALELVAPDQGQGGGTRLEFKTADGKPVTTLLLGAQHMRESAPHPEFGGGGSWPDGRYVMVDGDLKRVALVSDPLSNVEPRASDWLNKDFLKVEKIKSVAVISGDPTNQWKLVRETEGGPWTLADAKEGETVDTTKTGSANTLLSSPYFNDVMVNPDPAATGLDAPREAVLETFDDFTYRIKLGKPDAEGGDYALQATVTASLPKERTPGPEEKEEDKAKLDMEFKDRVDKLREKLKKEQAYAPWTYAVSKWTVDFLLKDRAELLAQPKSEESSASAPSTTVTPSVPVQPPLPSLPNFVPELNPDN